MVAGGGVLTTLGGRPVPVVSFKTLKAVCVMTVVEAATGVGAGVQLTSHKLILKTVFQVNEDSHVGEAIADARSKGVVAGKSVQPVVESLRLNWTDNVETTLYSVRVYHQSREAPRTFNVSPLHLLGGGIVEFPVGLSMAPVDPT